MLDGHAMEELADTAELLASELVTNAYRHTDGPSAMALRGMPDGRLRVTVRDADPTVPPPFDRPPCAGGGAAPAGVADTGAEGGRGLHIVRLCADNWGCRLLGGGGTPPGSGPRGKLLWVELMPPRSRYAVAA